MKTKEKRLDHLKIHSDIKVQCSTFESGCDKITADVLITLDLNQYGNELALRIALSKRLKNSESF
jgi:hypothetical protein